MEVHDSWTYCSFWAGIGDVSYRRGVNEIKSADKRMHHCSIPGARKTNYSGKRHSFL